MAVSEDVPVLACGAGEFGMVRVIRLLAGVARRIGRDKMSVAILAMPANGAGKEFLVQQLHCAGPAVARLSCRCVGLIQAPS